MELLYKIYTNISEPSAEIGIYEIFNVSQKILYMFDFHVKRVIYQEIKQNLKKICMRYITYNTEYILPLDNIIKQGPISCLTLNKVLEIHINKETKERIECQR